MKCLVVRIGILMLLESVQGSSISTLFSPRQCSLDSRSSPSSAQLQCYTSTGIKANEQFCQTAHGITYPSLTASQAIGMRGPILLQDAFLIETLQSFVRERIPERVVHAKGAGAFGYFKVTNDVTKYTKADFLKLGRRTRVAVRMSTVGGESGSADTNIDPKGFATKFYTNEGIYDLVANNIEVFPVRDPMLFAEVSRSRKRNPQTHLADPTAFWDFTSLRPETTMHTLFLFSDTARPKSLTYIDGGGVHTFKMVNADDIPCYVKFHWKSNQKNKKYFTPDETVQMAGTNPDVLLQDLFDRIERNEYLSWNLYIQVMTFDQAEKHPQNPFDVTKFWKVKDYPMIMVGTMILNENPTDYFTQVEQLAFSPSHMVPGIEPSPDRMLHARMFSYPDAQLYRLGVNFAQIPVNRCPFAVNTYQKDGHMNVGNNGAGAPNYFPNSFGGSDASCGVCGTVKQSVFRVCGDVDRVDSGQDDNFSLPKYYLEELVTADEQDRIIRNIAAFLGKAAPIVQENFINKIAYNISEEFGDRLKTILKHK